MKKNPYHDFPEDSDAHEDLRAGWAIGFAKAAEISGIAMEAILPSLLGVWLDMRLGTVLLFFAIGLIFGLTAATIHLLRLVAH
ncbi:MAG: AtpZ/AtpI family protein [Planctomycetia bacterium]|nr:AtpZ/AtpI family protein [Planctomycetia bacterium]